MFERHEQDRKAYHTRGNETVGDYSSGAQQSIHDTASTSESAKADCSSGPGARSAISRSERVFVPQGNNVAFFRGQPKTSNKRCFFEPPSRRVKLERVRCWSRLWEQLGVRPYDWQRSGIMLVPLLGY